MAARGPGHELGAERLQCLVDEEAGPEQGLDDGEGVLAERLRSLEEVDKRTEQADAVLLGREFLRTPYWPMTAAADLGVGLEWPDQYHRAKPV